MSRLNQEESAHPIAETVALLRHVDQCLGAAMRCMAGPPRSNLDGSHLLGELSLLEGQLHRHLAGAREAISRCEQNERIVAADRAKINGDRAREEYERARDAIDDEAEQHRRNELDIQEKLSAIRTTVGQMRAWQWSRPLIEPPRSFPQRDFLRDFGGCPPWSKQSAQRELDDLLRRPVRDRRPSWWTPPFV